MKNNVETSTVGEILFEEFMKPNNISAYKLAKEINVPISSIQGIIHNRSKINVDTSLRLARFFGVSDKYFLDMQNDIDIRNSKRKGNIKMENSINILRSLKKERKILSNRFDDAMQQKNISKALEIKVRQDSICDEIIKIYDQLIEKNKEVKIENVLSVK